MARPKSLTTSGIAAAALAVIDRDGLAALSMRSVGVELGMGTMSLYRYVASREELERLVVDLALGKVDTALPARGSWDEHVTILAGRIRDAVRAHPAVVPLMMAHHQDSLGVWRCAEAVLGALTAGGFTGRNRVIALRTLVSFLNGTLQAQHLGPLDGAGTAAMAALAETGYPLVAETAREARHVSPDEEFRDGFAAVLRGLASMRAHADQAR